MLSGFLIGNLLFKLFTAPNFSPKKLGYFLVRRWFRTFPNYYLALILNIVIVWYLGRELPETLGRYFFFCRILLLGWIFFYRIVESSNRGICLPPGPHTLVCVAFTKNSLFTEDSVSGHYPFSPYIFFGKQNHLPVKPRRNHYGFLEHPS